ncbi:MAG: cell wall hydrolase [Lachnospiraceae bacterium]|nr:cell wall hydrolase [Lachnospiraceae bacterium]MBR4174679.1 cell wall hydrolase [Lachnospiraceae bacterium]
MLTSKLKAAVKAIMISGAITVLSTVSVMAAPVDYETFVKSTLAGEFVLPSKVMSEFKEAINSGDTDRGMEIYNDYFDGDDSDGISYEVACSGEDEDADEASADSEKEEAAAPKVEETKKSEEKVQEVKGEPKAAESEAKAAETAAPEESQVQDTEVLGQTQAPDDGDHYGLSDADYMNLCKIVHAEAHTQGVAGMQLVANVVLNRVKNYRFPNSVTAVIAQPGQFSPVASGRFAASMPSPAAMAAVDKALSGEDNSKGALYFRKSTSPTNWGNRIYMFTYGGQSFYIN